NHQNKNATSHMLSGLQKDEIDKDRRVIYMGKRMHQMNGQEHFIQMRNMLPDVVKIVALTAQALPEEREEILNDGFDALLMKPFTEAGLLHILEKYGQSTTAIDFTELPPDSDTSCGAVDVPAVTAEHSLVSLSSSKNGSLDLSRIQKMTFGDQELMRKILKRFIEDSTNDIQQLMRKIDSFDKEEIALLLHRIAGRTSQLGADELGARFRQEEDSVRQNGLPD